MERRLVKQGRNALTITVPAKWAKERKLGAGDAVQVEPRGEDLVVVGSRARASKETTIDLREMTRSSVWHLVTTAYIEGYDIITVLHDNPAVVQEMAGHLIGFVVHEHTPTRTVLKTIVSVPEQDSTQLLRRAGHLFVQQAHTMVLMTKGEATHTDVKNDEKLLDDTLRYCMRSFVKYRHEREHELYLLCAWIEMAADMLSIIAKHIEDNQELAQRTHKIITTYVEGIFANDYKKLFSSLRAYRESLGKDKFVDGVAFAFADMLYNNIGSFVVDPRHQNI